MSDQAQEASAVAQVGHRPRRPSFRKSLTECGLPPGYLDALEDKRRQLDESIHKFIASKEREYKQFEKVLKHQARRETAEREDTVEDGNSQEKGPPTIATRTQEDFTGLFTPEYLHALSHEEEEHHLTPRSTPDQPVDDTPSKQTDAPLKAPPLLAQRSSSSGCGIDGRLISAMKSVSMDATQPRRKRVSLAVGNSIVAPSDSVPVALSVNSTSSHSRLRGPKHARSAPFESVSIPISLLTPALQHTAKPERQAVAGKSKPVHPGSAKLLPGEDVGDMFDLEDTDSDTPNVDLEDDNQDAMPDSLADVAGRVRSPPTTQHSDGYEDTGEPPPPPEDDDLDEVPLTPISGSFSAQPMDPGFRRPSAVSDPVYTSERSWHTSRAADDDGIYSSSFSKPTSRGSFTMSGSLGESYMAKNAEAIMGLKAQQQRPEARHRTSSTVLPVR